MKVILAILVSALLLINVFLLLMIVFYAIMQQISYLLITCIIFITTIISFVMIASLFLFSYASDNLKNKAIRGYYYE
jgi:hypothetical protein